MAIMPNPIKDPKTGVYKIRQVVPKELRPFLEDKGELKRSLDTKNPREAKARAAPIIQELQVLLADARSRKAQHDSPAAFTEGHIDAFANAWRQRELARLREPDILARYVLSEPDTEGVGMLYSSHAGLYGDALEPIGVGKDGKPLYSARRLHAAMREIAQECLAFAQVELASDHPLYTYLCNRLAHHCVSISTMAFKSHRHLIDEGIAQLLTPLSAPAAAPVADVIKLTEFFDKIAAGRIQIDPKGASKWRSDRASVVRRFVEVFGDLPLNRITKQQCVEFRDLLTQTPCRPNHAINVLPLLEQIDKAKLQGLKTITLARVKGQLLLLSGILKRAHGDAIISDNPCQGIALEVPKTTRQRDSGYSDAEMTTLFTSEIFTGAIRPKRANYGEAVYWVPVLLAYTGARLEEICQLFRRDIQREGEQWVICIQDLDDTQSLKTGKSRVIPLHPHLLELGFDRFITSCPASGPLFPEIAPKKQGGRYSDGLGKWFRKQLQQLLMLEPGEISPLHALRHTFVTNMREREEEEVRNFITGHSQGSSVGRRYGEFTFKRVYKAVCIMPCWPVPIWRPHGVDDTSAAAAEVKA